MNPSIECEIRSFVSEGQYARLLDFFRSNAEFLGEDEQETHYFDCPLDLRIQKNSRGAKIWMKKGRMHDERREEIEIPCAGDDFAKAGRLFESLGYPVKIKWFRKRLNFRWNGLNVALDDTRGYGKIIELEKIRAADEDNDSVIAELKSRLSELGLVQTPKSEFEKKFSDYQERWRELTALS